MISDGTILHCMHAEKFIEPFIDFLEKNFDASHHQFLIRQSKHFTTKTRKNVVKLQEGLSKFKLLLQYYKYMNSAEKIIFHGLFHREQLIILLLQPWLLKKCYWVIWGSDLYCYKNKPMGFRSDLFKKIRSSVIGRIGHIITHIKGDYELAKEWYGARGQWHECFMYPSNLYNDYSLKPKIHDTINIQVGNSADPSNNHLEVLEKLKTFRDQAIQIYVPLSYGDQQHAQVVIAYGVENFGNKFVPLTTFMPFEKYLDLLAQIDIAIFNHRRQQGMGNITTLLGLGKKVYMRSDVTPWAVFESLGIKLFDCHILELTPMDNQEQNKNAIKVKNYFSELTLRTQWQRIFEG